MSKAIPCRSKFCSLIGRVSCWQAHQIWSIERLKARLSNELIDETISPCRPLLAWTPDVRLHVNVRTDPPSRLGNRAAAEVQGKFDRQTFRTSYSGTIPVIWIGRRA